MEKYEDVINCATYELGGIHALMGGLYERYLERSYGSGIRGEELLEFVSAYGACMDLIQRERDEIGEMLQKCGEERKV